MRLLLIFLFAIHLSFGVAHAGQLDREDVSRQLDGRYTIGEVQPDFRAYPVFIPAEETADNKPKLMGYAFETVDFTSIRGYSGKPINLFVLMDLDGKFLKIRLLEHNEPLFLSIHSNAKLIGFTNQLVQLGLQYETDIHGPNDPMVRNDKNVSLQGVHRGTISAKAIDRSIFTAAAKIALAKLDPAILARPETKYASPPPSGSAPTDKSAEAGNSQPQVSSKEPTTTTVVTEQKTDNKNKMIAATEEKVVDKSSLKGSAATEQLIQSVGQVKDQLAQDQSQVGLTMADNNTSSLASSKPSQLERLQNMAAEEESQQQQWVLAWRSRSTEIAVLVLVLVVLTTGLIAQKRLSANSKTLRMLRTAYLIFTLGFIGWYAQGQLSIVNVTGALESVSTGGDLGFLMNDPMTVILWVFTAASLLVWGRGTFCGWLCPFGAFQELVSLMANAIGIHQKRLRNTLDAKLKWIKYGVLATLLISLFAAPSIAQMTVEIEPFKTAISLYFVREWPYVCWALLCLAFGVFVYRGYCRYICPLGAALASLNFLQRWSWIARRDACGAPCQSCRYRCEYQAIETSGKINYSECFQCLDCVSIYQDPKRCMPLIQQSKSHIPVVAIK